MKCVAASALILISGLNPALGCDCNEILKQWKDKITKIDSYSLAQFIKKHQEDTIERANSAFKQEFSSESLNIAVFDYLGADGSGERGTINSSTTKLKELHLLDTSDQLTKAAYSAFYSETASPISLAAYKLCIEHSYPPSCSTVINGSLVPKLDWTAADKIKYPGRFSITVSYNRRNEYEPSTIKTCAVTADPTWKPKLENAAQGETLQKFSIVNKGSRLISFTRPDRAQSTITIQVGKLNQQVVEIPTYIPEVEPPSPPPPVMAKPAAVVIIPNFHISATRSTWSNTDVTIKPQQWLTVDGISGTWTIDKWHLNTYPKVGPEGYTPGVMNAGALAGRIGYDKFYVGRNLKMQYNGQLEMPLKLAMEDGNGPDKGDGYTDNYGEVIVRICVYDSDPDVLIPQKPL